MNGQGQIEGTKGCYNEPPTIPPLINYQLTIICKKFTILNSNIVQNLDFVTQVIHSLIPVYLTLVYLVLFHIRVVGGVVGTSGVRVDST
jgi:hypothetical protein